MTDVLLGAALVVNVVAFAAMGFDKRRARLGGRRVPESFLLLLAACAGFPGVWLGASAFRHKTRKRSFQARLVLATLACLFVVWLAAR